MWFAGQTVGLEGEKIKKKINQASNDSNGDGDDDDDHHL